MDSSTVAGQDILHGQYVHAKPVFVVSTEGVHTVFTNPDLSVARIEHFAVHSFELNLCTISHAFALVKWMECHPEKQKLGKPFEVWCRTSCYDTCNYILPVENISCLLLSIDFKVCGEVVLVTVPLLL